MNYALSYTKNIIPQLFFVCTLGLFKPFVNDKVRLTSWVLDLFWIMDVLPILICRGKVTSVWHHKASDLFCKEKLITLAAEDNKYWRNRLFSVTCQVLFFPDIF